MQSTGHSWMQDRSMKSMRDAARVRPERGAAVHEGHRPGDGFQAQRPVAGAVAAADDDHVLAGVRAQRGYEERQATPHPAGAGRQRARGERADAAADHDGPAPDAGTRAGAHGDDAVIATGQGLCALAKHEGRLVRTGLLHQRRHEVAALDRGQTGHVVDGLLRVHRADLAACLWKRVDDHSGQSAESGVIGGVQADRTVADDQHVTVDRVHRRLTYVGSAGSASRPSAAPRSSPRRKLPVAVVGYPSTKTTLRGLLYDSIPSRQNTMSSSSVTWWPAFA